MNFLAVFVILINTIILHIQILIDKLFLNEEVTMAKIKEIADKLGISVSTVSKGLNGASDISAETRQLVLETALEMGYVNKRGKSLFGKHICAVIVRLPYSNINEYGYEVISGFRIASAKKNYLVSVITLADLENADASYDKAMKRLGYDGAFFIGITRDDAYLEQFRSTRTPTVLFEEYVHNPHVAMVCTDLVEGTYLCVKHLYEAGHHAIAFINGTDNCLSSQMRMHGYRQALQDFHIPYRPELVASTLYYPPDSARPRVAELLKAGATGIVCANDYIAAAVIAEAARLGKKIPKDLSVIGFDNIPLASYLNPRLTTINENRVEIGYTALKTLDTLMHGENVGIYMTHPEMITRLSTGPVPDRSSKF